MATAIRRGDRVTLDLSIEEALYVTAELGGGNTHFHGLADDSTNGEWDATPFAQLARALKVGAHRRGPLAAQYRAHQRVTAATRPQYDSDAGTKQAEREGFLPLEAVDFPF